MNIIRKLLFGLMIACLATMINCSDNSETAIDCSQSDLSISVTNSIRPSCTVQGTIETTGNGGEPPYMYSIDGINFQSSSMFTNVAAGAYTITISDANDCTSQVNTNLLASEDAITVEFETTNSDCGDPTGSITVNAVGGDGNYMYSINGGTEQRENFFENIGNGPQRITVSDGEGCSATKFVTVMSGVSWMEQISPIFNVNCTISGCHNGDNENIPNFSVFANVQSFAGAIKINTENRNMPRAGSGLTLTEDEIDLIVCWVDDGALDN